jgi:Transposase DDE domain
MPSAPPSTALGLEELRVLFDDPPRGEPMPSSLRFGRRGERNELRLLRCSAALVGYTDWPHLGYACTIQWVVTRAGMTTYQQHYAITSLTPDRITAAGLQELWRGHWGIENRLHYVRDVTLGEDASRMRTGNEPQALAAVRNAVLGTLRRAGHTNLAAALRTYAGKPRAALALLGVL